MKVELLHYTPIGILIHAIRQCYDSFDKSDSYCETRMNWQEGNLTKDVFIVGEKDKALIKKVIESGHTSTLEHISFNFHLKDFTRDVLQELSRHRIASASVKSTRYTLKELKNETSFIYVDDDCNIHFYGKINKYVELTGIKELDRAIAMSVEAIRVSLNNGYTNDEVKPALPESYLVSSIFTINLRSFRNFLELRSSNRAYHKIRKLALAMHDQVPEEYKFTVEDCIYKRDQDA